MHRAPSIPCSDTPDPKSGLPTPSPWPCQVSSDFQHYKSGIYDGNCTTDRKGVNHAVVAVGYGYRPEPPPTSLLPPTMVPIPTSPLTHLTHAAPP